MARNAVERLSLKDQLKQDLEEARVVLPGIQALFGFQLIAAFQKIFYEKLMESEQRLHLCALGLTGVAVGLSMAISALHRQSQPESVSNRLVKLCTFLLTAGMFPLMIAIDLDFYLLCRLIVRDASLSVGLATALGAFLFLLWFVMPYMVRGYLKRPQPEHAELEGSAALRTSVSPGS